MDRIDTVKELREIINFAIEHEQESVDFYNYLIGKVRSKAVAAELSQIIAVEEHHRNKLQEIDVTNFAHSLQVKHIDLNIADYVLEEKPHPDMTLSELYNIALHRERKSLDLYTDLAKLFAGAEKELLESLAEEEMNHHCFYQLKRGEIALSE